MTERGRAKVTRARDMLSIGPSALFWDADGLTIRVDERGAPVPKRVRGTIRLNRATVNTRTFTLEDQGGHRWRPIVPSARVEVDLDAPDLRWRGHGYFDMNIGDEPLERGFSRWTWSRAATPNGATILYDAERRRSGPLSLGLLFDGSGGCDSFAPPLKTVLPSTRWRVARETRSDDGAASVTREFEDTPFYSRSLLNTKLHGQEVACIHESLSLDRFDHPLVKLMLPFRMPRW